MMAGPYLDGNMHAIVNGEIHALNGNTINGDCHIVGTAFDKTGKVLSSSMENVSAEDFFVLSQLTMHLSVTQMPDRIKIYSQRGLSE